MKTQKQRLLRIAYLILAAYTICAILFDLLLHADVMLPAPMQSLLYMMLIVSVFAAGNATLRAVGVAVLVCYLALLVLMLLSPLRKTKKKGFFFVLLLIVCVLDVIACVIIFFTGEHVLAVLNIVLDAALLIAAHLMKKQRAADVEPEAAGAEEANEA